MSGIPRPIIANCFVGGKKIIMAANPKPEKIEIINNFNDRFSRLIM